jgi:hypothetical protein
MNVSPGTVVPPALVLAMAGWSCWSIFGATAAPAAAAKPKPAESVAALLEPALGTLAERDPFAMPGEREPEAKAALTGAKGKPSEAPEAQGRRLLTAASKRLAAHLTAVRAAEAKRAEARERLTHLPLSATSIHPDRRVAIIGGRAYAEGETIDGTERSIGPVILAEVRPREVTVHSSVGPVEVRFTENLTRSSAPHSAAPTPKAGQRRSRQATGVVTIRGKTR